METDTIDLDALEKLADEATPGPWTTDAGDGPLDGKAKFQSNAQVLIYADDDCDIHPVADTSCNHSCRIEYEQAANAAFIAAANPSAIKALIAELKEARGLLKPFALAAEDLDDDHGDRGSIWEAPAAMNIDAGDLRAARAFLARNGKGEG